VAAGDLAEPTGERAVDESALGFLGLVPWYPGELFCDPATAKTVDQRWTEYFPSGRVAMGDSDEGHLGVD